MPKLPKTQKKTVAVVPPVPVEELNKPLEKPARSKPRKKSYNWVGAISLLVNIIIAVATSFIAYSIYVVEHNRPNVDSTSTEEKI